MQFSAFHDQTAALRGFWTARGRAVSDIAQTAGRLCAPVWAFADRVAWSRPLLLFSAVFAIAWWFCHLPGKWPDFTVLYAVRNHGPIYDAAWLTSLQPGPGLRPFAYPPTILLLLRPLDLMPYHLAYSVWVASTAALFVEAAGRLVRRAPWLVMASPVFFFTAGIGQTTLLIGALVIYGMTLPKRAWLAGALLGLAFAIKPQVVLLVPLALAFRQDWRGLFALGATGLALSLASLVFGWELWPAWVHSLGAFRAINDAEGIRRLGVPAAWLPLALTGAAAVVWATRRADPATRILVVMGASLLISPHAVFYEKAMLLPAGLALIMGRRWQAPAAAALQYFMGLSTAALAGYVLIVGAPSLVSGLRALASSALARARRFSQSSTAMAMTSNSASSTNADA